MLPLIGIVASVLLRVFSAVSAAGKLFTTQISKIGKRTPSPSETSEDDIETGKDSREVKLKEVAVAVEVENEGEDVLSELMKAHKLFGPARFLSTIEEETSEDLRSEDGRERERFRRRMKLVDLMHKMDDESGCLSPIASPVNKSTRPLTGSMLVNPMFDSNRAEWAHLPSLRDLGALSFKNTTEVVVVR